MVARRRNRTPGRPTAAARATPRHGLARVLSRRGVCSRAQAERWIRAGRVAVDGRAVDDPEWPVVDETAQISIDGALLAEPVRRYVALNKPRGLVTSTADERGRDTVYRCLSDASLPWLAPVGRLDRASEGLLLFCNDPAWAARLTDPETGPDKTYHVQVDAIPDAALLEAMVTGVDVAGELLCAKAARLLRTGTRNAWLEVVLDEGRNRHIRRLLGALELEVLRLVRVAIGGLALGDLPKGQWRDLTRAEVERLSR